MGFLGDLFGGGGSESEVKQYPAWNPQQQTLFNQLFRLVDLNKPAPPSPPMSVPRTPEEQAYFDFVSGLAQNRAMSNLLTGQVPYTVGDEYARNYYEQTLRPEYMRNLTEVTLPAIEESYTGPTYYGSSRARATTRAAEETSQRLNEAFNQLMYNEELARRQAIENAYGRVLPATQLMGYETGQAGQYARMIEQERVAADLQKFLMGEDVNGYQSPYYTPSVNLALSLLGFQPYVYTGVSKEQGPGFGYGTVTGFARGLGKFW